MSPYNAQIRQLKTLLSKNITFLRCSVVRLSFDKLEAKLLERGLPISKITLLGLEKSIKLPNTRTLLHLSIFYGISLGELVSKDLKHAFDLEEKKRQEKLLSLRKLENKFWESHG